MKVESRAVGVSDTEDFYSRVPPPDRLFSASRDAHVRAPDAPRFRAAFRLRVTTPSAAPVRREGGSRALVAALVTSPVLGSAPFVAAASLLLLAHFRKHEKFLEPRRVDGFGDVLVHARGEPLLVVLGGGVG